jgi:hypothetical protein
MSSYKFRKKGYYMELEQELGTPRQRTRATHPALYFNLNLVNRYVVDLHRASTNLFPGRSCYGLPDNHFYNLRS